MKRIKGLYKKAFQQYQYEKERGQNKRHSCPGVQNEL